jgi:hypothetical protein
MAARRLAEEPPHAPQTFSRIAGQLGSSSTIGLKRYSASPCKVRHAWCSLARPRRHRRSQYISDTPRPKCPTPQQSSLQLLIMSSSQEHTVSFTEGPPAPPPFSNAPKRPAPRGPAAYPRKRAVTACQVCRARRTKCDNLKPSCSFCLKVGAKCVQSSVDLSSYDPASLQILQRLDDLEQLVRGIGTSENTTETTDKVPIPNQDRSNSSIPSTSSNEEDRQRTLNDCSTVELYSTSLDRLLDWESLKSLRGLRQPNERMYPCTGSNMMQTTTTTTPMSSHEELEPQRTKTLLDNFFNYVHVKNPVLDEQRTRQTVSRVCMHGIDWSPEACLTLLVCALGTIATPFLGCRYISRDSDAYRIAESFFLAAKKRLGMLLGTSSLIEAQCMFLAGVYAMCTFQRLPAWRFFMQSLACCQTFESLKAFRQNYGEQLDETGRRSAAAEQAIYWSAWKSEREIHHELGLPGYLFSEIDITGYPPFFPTPPKHEDEQSSPDVSETERREQVSWYFYLSEISLLRLRRRMDNEIKSIEPKNGRSPLPDLVRLVAHHEQQILDWANALPDTISINAPPDEDDVCRFVLRGHLINVHEMLYWPFVDWAINTPSLHAEDWSLVELMTKGLRSHLERIIVNRPGFQHRHHGTFGMIMSCTRSALVLLAAGHTCATSKSTVLRTHHMLIGWQEAVQDVIRLNELWEHEAPDLSSMVLILNDLWQHWTRILVV